MMNRLPQNRDSDRRLETNGRAIRGVRSLVGPLLILMLSIPLVYGCEESISNTDIELPYKEELVVQGMLTAGSLNDTIKISRTLPPLENYSEADAAVTDADGTVTGDGIEYRLVHIDDGIYYVDGLRPEAGKTYRLDVSWKGLKVNASASIPPPTEVVRIFLDTLEDGCGSYVDINGNRQTSQSIRARVEYVPHGRNSNRARVEVVYSYNGSGSSRQSYGYHDRFREIDSSGPVATATLFEECDDRVGGSTDFRLDTLYFDFLELNEAYTAYDESLYNDNDDIFFGSHAETVVWNVYGDGFGWFFGQNESQGILVFE